MNVSCASGASTEYAELKAGTRRPLEGQVIEVVPLGGCVLTGGVGATCLRRVRGGLVHEETGTLEQLVVGEHSRVPEVPPEAMERGSLRIIGKLTGVPDDENRMGIGHRHKP